MKHILLTLLLIFNFSVIYSQIDSCWDMVLPHDPAHGYFNPDSVLYDTCLCKTKPWLPPYCKYVYAKQWFGLNLPNGALNIPQAPRDSIILRNWRDIDSSFTDLRAGFENLENIFGNFSFMKVFPDDIDTNSIGSRYFKIRFDSYVNIDSASNLIDSIKGIKGGGYLGRYNYYENVNDSIYNNEQKILIISPNPCNNLLKITGYFVIKTNIQIITLQGIILYSKKFTELNYYDSILINTSELPNGIYYIRIGNNIQPFFVIH